MKIEVNLSKSKFFVIVLSLLLVAGAIFSYAYNPSGLGGNPAVSGHDPSEIGAGRFSNFTASDEWIFPGSVSVESLGFDGNGARGVFVDSEGTLFSEALPGPESELSLVDEFIGGPDLGWDFGSGPYKSDNLATVQPSEMNRPGIISYNTQMILTNAIYSAQFFDVSFLVKSSVFKNEFESSSIGLYKDGNTRIAFDVYEAGYTAKDNWLTVTENGGVQTITKTNVPIGTSWVKLRIIRKDPSQIEFYINDNLVATHTTNIPDASMSIGTFNHPYGTLYIDSFRLSINDVNKRALSCNQIYDSGASNVALAPGFASLAVPSACMSSSGGCVVKQEIYNSLGVKYTRSYNYKQEANNKWTGSYYFGKTYINGDTSSVNIIPSYHDSRILLRDDYSATEVASSTWTVRDSSTSYAQKLYACTYV